MGLSAEQQEWLDQLKQESLQAVARGDRFNDPAGDSVKAAGKKLADFNLEDCERLLYGYIVAGAHRVADPNGGTRLVDAGTCLHAVTTEDRQHFWAMIQFIRELAARRGDERDREARFTKKKRN